MQDFRLFGVWHSDAKKTTVEIVSRRDIPVSRKRKLQSLFGKLELRFTRTHCYATLGSVVRISRYIVVAKDSDSVAIVSRNPISGRQIFHIHFEDDHFWICLGRIREFFKRKKRKAVSLR
jgi:hypothetical protein